MEVHGIFNTGIHLFCFTLLKFWENYITELYDQAIRPENLEVEPEEAVDANEKGPYILHSEVRKAIKELKDKKATGDYDVPENVLKLFGRRWSQTKHTTDQQHI
jgi:hypothetical protein